MSPTTITGRPRARASPMFTMSCRRRLISAGEPAPSHTTTSNRERRSSKASSTVPSSRARPASLPQYPTALASPAGRPRTTRWLLMSLPGLSSTGFMAASAGTRAAAACIACARPISAPSGVTMELLDMFCALNGATRTPCLASHRQIPAVSTHLPASDAVPATSSDPLICATIARMRIEQRLAELGLELPQPQRTPAGLELPFPWVRLWPGRAFVSGHGPLRPDGTLTPLLGKVGADLTEEQAYTAARDTALAMLASLRRALGDLDRVTGWLRVFGMVNTAPGFTRTPAVINGFSDLIVDLWGPDAGPHARSAIGVAELPFGIPVEVEAEVAVD